MTLHRLAYFVVLPLLLSAAGCSTVGEKQFACPGRPPGVHCLSTTGVYAATENTDVVAVTADHALGDSPSAVPRQKQKQKMSHRETSTESTHAGRTRFSGVANDVASLAAERHFPTADKPIPIRTPAQVMRVWMAPWEDSRGILHAGAGPDGGSYYFIEIESRRWQFGERPLTEPERVLSLQKARVTNVNAKEPDKKEPASPSARTGANDRSPKSASIPSTNSGVSK